MSVRSLPTRARPVTQAFQRGTRVGLPHQDVVAAGVLQRTVPMTGDEQGDDRQVQDAAIGEPGSRHGEVAATMAAHAGSVGTDVPQGPARARFAPALLAGCRNY